MEKRPGMIMLDQLNLEEKDLLENWYNETPFKEQHPMLVNYAFGTLKFFFGRDYFKVKPRTDKPIERISWINGLLADRERVSSFYALIDVCRLIEYMVQSLPASIGKGALDLIDRPQQLRNFFYELFIYRIIDGNEIANEKKIFINNQELEGTCVLDNRTFLFECRKVFMPEIDILDTVRRMMDALVMVIGSTKPSGRMICRFTFSRPVERVHLADLIKLFAEYEKQAVATEQYDIPFYRECHSGNFSVSAYSDENLKELRAARDYDVICAFEGPQSLDNGSVINPTFIGGNYSVAHEKVYKKIKSVLRKKHRQHRNSPIKDRIIFIDSESLPEFEMNIFNNDRLFDLERIRQIHQELNMTEIVCITRRIFFDEGPTLAVDVITTPEEAHMEKVLKDLFQIMFTGRMKYG